MNLISIWLMTMRTASRQPARLAGALRWLGVVSVGILIGPSGRSVIPDDPREKLAAYWRSECFVLLSLALEMPMTFLLYLHLRALAIQHAPNSLRLRHGFAALAGIIPVLMLAAMLAFPLSRLHIPRWSPAVLIISGIYGAVSMVAAAWATALIFSLITHIVFQQQNRRPNWTACSCSL